GWRRGLMRWHDGRFDDLAHAFAPAPGAHAVGVVAIHQDHEGGIWYGSRGAGLSRLSPTWRNFAVLMDPRASGRPASLHAASEDTDGGLWLVGDAGLLLLADGSTRPRLVVGAEAF